jgi:hypothetical protein
MQGRSVGVASRRRGLLSAPARALREVLLDVVATEGPNQPGVHAERVAASQEHSSAEAPKR